MKKFNCNWIVGGIAILMIFWLSSSVQGQSEKETVFNARIPLQIGTYDKCNQMNHPDVIYVNKGWNAYRYWMVFTPYPYGDRKHENPSVRVSNDGIRWDKPSELMPDPIVPPPPDSQEGGFNSDPDLVLMGKVMYLFYRTTTVNKVTTVYYKTSTNGVAWSEPHPTDLPSTTTSPAIEYDGMKFHCWFVEYTGRHHEPYAIKYSLSEDGRIWSKPESVSLDIPEYTPWHLNVIKTDEGFEMLLTAYHLSSDNGHTVLFYAWSENGLQWLLPSKEPFLKPVKNSWDSKQIYRASLVKDDSGYKIWYSAADVSDKWGIGYISLAPAHETFPGENELVKGRRQFRYSKLEQDQMKGKTGIRNTGIGYHNALNRIFPLL